ncbi:MAG: hypothetical protein QOG59_1762 [Solirubrobacteraceae bacterium]|nr:hypothetical protein [Solirubrobacteraceae bacterium]
MISSSRPGDLAQTPLADPVAEARRLIDAARARDLTIRAVGGVAVYLQAPEGRPLLPRPLKDIDIVAGPGEGKATARLLAEMNYVGEEMFNALRGSRRQLFHDLANGRELDVFIGEFAMCHAFPIAERLDHHPYTVPLAELLLTKLQIVELNERDERDIYTLCYHHRLSDDGRADIDAAFIARLCADDWGLWRTCSGTIERCVADLGGYDLEPAVRAQITQRLTELSQRLAQEPKSGRWKRRARLGERKRWYQEPEEV